MIPGSAQSCTNWLALICLLSKTWGQLKNQIRSKMEATVLRYMDAGEEESVVHRINHLKHEIKALYNIDCMILERAE